MGWDNPPVPWQELERRLSWRTPRGQAKEPRPHPADGQQEPRPHPADGRPAREPRPRPVTRLPGGRDSGAPAWAELHCHSSYSFLDGASAPAELVAEAARRGLAALAITDHDGMYGVPQFAQAADRLKEQAGTGIGTVFGAELSLGLSAGFTPAARPERHGPARGVPADPRWPAPPRTGVPDPGGRHLLVLARDPEGYRRLCRVISMAQLAGGEKGRPRYDLESLAQ